MTEIQRIKKVVAWLIFQENLNSQKELAEKMGYTESSMSNILNENVPLSGNFIKKIAMMNDSINEDWILTGKGEMIKYSISQSNVNGDNIQGHSVSVNKTQTDKFIDLLKTKDEQINKSQKQIDKSQEQIDKSQEQIDRLIGLIEKLNNI